MKTEDIRELREVILNGSYIIPDQWIMVKSPTKILENGNEVFKLVIGRK